MSYILDVLKKLESENKRIERNTDLKEAVLSDDASSTSHEKSPSINPVTAGFSVSFLVILVLIIFGGGFFYYFTHKDEKKISSTLDSQKSAHQSTISQTDTHIDDVSPEIREEGPETARSYHSEKKGITLDALREEEKKRTDVTKNRPVKKSLKEQTPLPSAAHSIDDELSDDFLLDQRERDDSSSSDDEEIPYFTIKGAMYVGRGARANYVLIEYDGKTHRLKEGESAGKITLLRLHSDKAFFRFKRKDFMRTF